MYRIKLCHNFNKFDLNQIFLLLIVLLLASSKFIYKHFFFSFITKTFSIHFQNNRQRKWLNTEPKSLKLLSDSDSHKNKMCCACDW